MDYIQKFNDDFRELFTKPVRENADFGKELWSALANVSWYHESDSDNTECGYSFRAAGSLIASMLCHGDYMDWYCSGPDGIVSKYIAEKLGERGWRYEAEKELCLKIEDFEKLKPLIDKIYNEN